ncbi:DUF1993 family protein [Sphingomonas sp.]|uniref:DUF1993 domain-containing protein n=1 Tax=Sphingomonas sp. TaxID=28214 RepID=UPI0025EA2A47|nr:DUF1993 domain-containing protein [Sphingomonas sp.]
MTLSMYQASAPIFLRQFAALTAIITKAEAFAAAGNFDEAQFIDARLAPDMLNFAKQVQIATDGAKAGIARLAGVEIPAFPDSEVTFAQLKARIAKTVAFIESVPAAGVDGSENKAIAFKIRDRDLAFTGQSFLLHFVLPNFFFHVTTAYAILRHKGVQIGKMDFLGAS